jgi:hypothetical protein
MAEEKKLSHFLDPIASWKAEKGRYGGLLWEKKIVFYKVWERMESKAGSVPEHIYNSNSNTLDTSAKHVPWISLVFSSLISSQHWHFGPLGNTALGKLIPGPDVSSLSCCLLADRQAFYVSLFFLAERRALSVQPIVLSAPLVAPPIWVDNGGPVRLRVDYGWPVRLEGREVWVAPTSASRVV